MLAVNIREPTPSERHKVDDESLELGGPVIVSAGKLRDLRAYPCRVAVVAEELAGFIIYREEPDSLEILAIKARQKLSGIGTMLLTHVEEQARQKGKANLWLCTTNDNLDALRFYQRRGFRVREYWVGGFAEVLRLKGVDPSKRVVGNFEIPLRDIILLDKAIAHGL